MRNKFINIILTLQLLFITTGCGEDSSSKRSISSTEETRLNVEFKNAKDINQNYQKANRNDVSKVLITVTKGENVYLENALMVKDSTTQQWGIGFNLDNTLAPYNVLVLAQDSSGKTLFKSKAGTQLTDLTQSVTIVVDEVIDEIPDFTVLPTVESITHNISGNTVNMHFVINNAVNYELNSSTGGTFNLSEGTFSTSEASLDVVYTLSSVDETTILLKIKLTNGQGDTSIIPFSIKLNTLSINFPPSSIKIDVEEQLVPTNTYKIKATVTDEDSSSWSYAWGKIRGAKLLPNSGTENILELEGLNRGEAYPLCFNVTVTDEEGGSSKVDYCIKNANNGYQGIKKTKQTRSYNETTVVDNSSLEEAYKIRDDGYYQKGLTPYYIRDSETNTVRDYVTGLIWQDDSAVKSTTKIWTKANEYCSAKGEGWRLPTIVELQSIVTEELSSSAIDTTVFLNTYNSSYWTATGYRNSSSSSFVWSINFYSGSTSTQGKTSSAYIRCVKEVK